MCARQWSDSATKRTRAGRRRSDHRDLAAVSMANANAPVVAVGVSTGGQAFLRMARDNRRLGQHLGADHPLQNAQIRIKRAAERRQRDVHDRVVQDDHKSAGDDHHQRQRKIARTRHNTLRENMRCSRGAHPQPTQRRTARDNQPDRSSDHRARGAGQGNSGRHRDLARPSRPRRTPTRSETWGCRAGPCAGERSTRTS